MMSDTIYGYGSRARPEKKGVRAFAVAESFNRPCTLSTLAGIVMRKDLVIDGIVFGASTLGGDDSTDSILSMFKKLKRNDINFVLLDGLIISMFNIIDAEMINQETGLPVIAVTFRDSKGIEESIKSYSQSGYNIKLEKYSKIGSRQKVLLRTGKSLFIRSWGISTERSIEIINSFTLQGAIPEPIRVAKMAAHAHTSPSNK